MQGTENVTHRRAQVAAKYVGLRPGGQGTGGMYYVEKHLHLHLTSDVLQVVQLKEM